jgi:hypothetical protein
MASFFLLGVFFAKNYILFLLCQKKFVIKKNLPYRYRYGNILSIIFSKIYKFSYFAGEFKKIKWI